LKGQEAIQQKIASMLEGKIKDIGLDLVDVEYEKDPSGWVLRLTIDKIDGIDHDDCVAVSRLAGDALDEKDPIPHTYRLEVTSPGIDRELKHERDYLRFMGERVDVHLYAPYEKKKMWVGALAGYDQGCVTIRLNDTELIKFERDQVAKVNLHVDF